MTDRTEYMKNQIVRYVTLAKEGLEKGFDCETARKDAMSGLGRAYDYVRDFHSTAMRPDRQPLSDAWYNGGTQKDLDALQAFDKKYELPFSLAHVREKHIQSFAKYGDVAQLQELVDLREQCKAATLIEKVTKKAAAKKAVIKSTAYPVISEATRPMKEAAVAETIRLANQYVNQTKALLLRHDYNPYSVVPVIEKVSEWSREYRSADADTRAAYQIQNQKAELADSARAPLFQFIERDADTYSWSVKGAQAYVAQEVRNTEAYYDAFVAKMVTKVPTAKEATYTLPNNRVWNYSILKITKADGSVDNWETKIMVNRSKYDRLFNQWRTRLL